MTSKMLWRGLGFGFALVLAVGGSSLHGQGELKGDLKAFMRQKLNLSHKVLEGLTLENYPLVAENARAMTALSQDARWRVSPNVNYLRLSAEFQDLADELAQKAKERNLDGATLAYVRLTLNCVKCHQYTRDNRLTRLDPELNGKRL
jgi:hypothetical protein